jgi:hypothetical protein
MWIPKYYLEFKKEEKDKQYCFKNDAGRLLLCLVEEIPDPTILIIQNCF